MTSSLGGYAETPTALLEVRLRRVSGQEKLPVLKLGDGTTVNGGGKIAKWATRNAAG